MQWGARRVRLCALRKRQRVGTKDGDVFDGLFRNSAIARHPGSKF